jgi:5'-deoxynucleotidase
LLEKIRYILGGGHVKRFHTVNTIRTQNNAEHSWGVASLVQMLAPNCSKELIIYAFWHDVPESITGDIPSTAKWKFPSLKNILTKIEDEIEQHYDLLPTIGESEYDILKVADSIETILFCREEQNMGNRNVQVIIDRCSEKVIELHKKMKNDKVIELLFKAREGEIK